MTEFSGETKVADKQDDIGKLDNKVSDETGQYDARFVLWRAFCAQNGISVDTLPGDLTGEAREKWEKLKQKTLFKGKA
jgi:hypothetical protein